jgi:hypothetical protein
MHEIIFEADTRAGKAFDVALLVCILLSVKILRSASVILKRGLALLQKYNPFIPTTLTLRNSSVSIRFLFIEDFARVNLGLKGKNSRAARAKIRSGIAGELK